MTTSYPRILTHHNDDVSPPFKWKNGIETVIDMGSQQIVCLSGRGREDGTLEVVGHGIRHSDGIKNGSIVDIERANEAVRQVLTNTEFSSKYPIKKITVGFSGGHPHSSLYELTIAVKGQVTQEDLERAARSIRQQAHQPGRTILHIIPIEYSTDGTDHIINPLNHACNKLTISVHILSVEDTALADLRQVMQKAEVNIDNIVYAPFAAPLCVLDKQEKQQGSTVIDIGSDLTSLVFWRNMRPLWSTQLTKGGHSITNDIALGLDMFFDDAERIKTLYEPPGTAPNRIFEYHHLGQQDLPKDKIDNVGLQKIIVPRVKENLEEIEKTLRHAFEVEDSCREACQHIVLTGGGALLDGLLPIAEDKLVPSPFTRQQHDTPYFPKNIHLGKPRFGPVISGESLQPIFSTSIGLLIWALCKNKPFRDYMHPPQRQRSLTERLLNIFLPFRRKV